jgi:DNA-directed RNA polymerase alpha subunit
MDPKIASIVEDNGVLHFQLQNTNVSFANAIRRTLLSDIPTLVMRDSPYDQTTINITKNTTRLNNEIIRHRLSCVPIHHDVDFPVDKYSFVVDIENTGNTVITLTTADIKVIDTDTGKEAPASISKQLFPPDPITNDYIPIVRINPRVSDQLPGEALSFVAKATVATADENSCFNVVSCAAYAMTVDKEKQTQTLTSHLKGLKAEYTKQGMSKDDIEKALEYAKNGWLALDGKRIVKKNSFDFQIETVGVFSNEELVRKACSVLVDKLDELEITLSQTNAIVDLFEVGQGDYVMVKLENYDYTIAKALEAVLYHRNWEGKEKADGIDYLATVRPHPHIPEIFLRLHFVDGLDERVTLEERSRMIVLNAIAESREVFKKVKALLPK